MLLHLFFFIRGRDLFVLLIISFLASSFASPELPSRVNYVRRPIPFEAPFFPHPFSLVLFSHTRPALYTVSTHSFPRLQRHPTRLPYVPTMAGSLVSLLSLWARLAFNIYLRPLYVYTPVKRSPSFGLCSQLSTDRFSSGPTDLP